MSRLDNNSLIVVRGAGSDIQSYITPHPTSSGQCVAKQGLLCQMKLGFYKNKRTVLLFVRLRTDCMSVCMNYFSQLSLDIVKKLYNVYKVDFEMFGYSPQMYYDYADNDVV